MPEVNDKAILAQLTGDPQAGLQALLDAYGGMIYAIVRRILPAAPQDAEECAADVLVAALPEPDHEIFLRRYYYLQPCRQIARALGMQEHTVNVRLSRGRARLKQQYLARMDPASRKETAL